MAVEVAGGPMRGKLVLRNISTLFSGDLSHPVLDADGKRISTRTMPISSSMRRDRRSRRA
jgi:hypothetical protein